MPRGKKASGPIAVEAMVHGEAKRKNIPTPELEGFLKSEDRAPKKVVYPRDASLDPQLVWKGKDEQDQHPLEVPAVPIYIQEKIAPKALIEDVRKHSNATADIEQVNLFADFNGIQFEDLVNFYQHQQNWSNRMILGDSLLVMTSLAEKEALKGQVQCIYMDPPYGIKFGSNWQVSMRQRDVQDGKVADATRQPEQIKAFRDTWELGIHSYLTYLRDRLISSRELLADTGSVFVQIGDENVHLVRSVLDEVFGSKNFVSIITYSKTTGATAELLPGTTDFILWYAKDRESVKFRPLFNDKEIGGSGAGKYDQLELSDGSRRAMTAEEKADPKQLPPGARPYRLDNLTSQSVGREKGEGAASWFPVNVDGREFKPNIRSRWKTNQAGMARLLAADRVQVTGNTLAYVRFIDDFPAFPLANAWMDIGGIQSRADPKVYVVQTATTAVERCVLMTTDPGDLVVDPTSGSGTTAYVAEKWGRRWIVVDTSRVALALARTRLMAARFPFYTLADSPAGQALLSERTGHAAPNRVEANLDIRRGFVYRVVPHVTLKSIAQNPEITPDMARDAVMAAVARNVESEALLDQPEIDPRTVRVTGPFTVESLSPHVAGSSDGFPDDSGETTDEQRFQRLVLDHLRTSGVQNTVREERLNFEAVEPWPGVWVHAVADYSELGASRRAAISIGPEYGTVTGDQVREAAKEAVKHFDLLIVCGFAFDGYVAEESKQLGSLTIVRAAMNPDISLGDDLLKKTGAGNLFMVFGEPDILVTAAGEEVTVEVRGLDVYDPTTGEVRSHSTDDIACWLIDTNYNGESFFVRHAYFLGADDPYEQLRRALHGDVNPAAWASMYSARSRAFPVPSTGKIAVKVINHYGDEVLKVYSV